MQLHLKFCVGCMRPTTHLHLSPSMWFCCSPEPWNRCLMVGMELPLGYDILWGRYISLLMIPEMTIVLYNLSPHEVHFWKQRCCWRMALCHFCRWYCLYCSSRFVVGRFVTRLAQSMIVFHCHHVEVQVQQIYAGTTVINMYMYVAYELRSLGNSLREHTCTVYKPLELYLKKT